MKAKAFYHIYTRETQRNLYMRKKRTFLYFTKVLESWPNISPRGRAQSLKIHITPDIELCACFTRKVGIIAKAFASKPGVAAHTFLELSIFNIIFEQQIFYKPQTKLWPRLLHSQLPLLVYFVHTHQCMQLTLKFITE